MKTKINSVVCISLSLLVLMFIFESASAQDATKVDPKHYKVEFENDLVRVLRITYAPGEKSIMHEHPDGVVVFLTDGKSKFTFPDGKTEESTTKAGQVGWSSAVVHLPENTGEKPMEVILIEMKVLPLETSLNVKVKPIKGIIEN